MPRYQVVNGSVQIGRVRYVVGSEVDYDGIPGVAMMPLDGDARAAKLAAVLADERAGHVTGGRTPGTVVPARLGSGHLRRIRLAKSLGAGELASYAEYDVFITNWIAQEQ